MTVYASRLIPLTQGKFAIVDAEDYDYLMQWKWHYSMGYAMHKLYRDGKSKTIMMHRVIAGTPDELQTDHINCNRLDNRKANLRNCTATQNQYNRANGVGKGSKYKGVSWHKHRGKWRASIVIQGQHKHLGLFDSEIDAAFAYNKSAEANFGEYVNINKIERAA